MSLDSWLIDSQDEHAAAGSGTHINSTVQWKCVWHHTG